MEIGNVDSIKADENGVTLIFGENKIFISWKVVDVIAEVSEPHYFSEMIVKEMTGMNDQKKLN